MKIKFEIEVTDTQLVELKAYLLKEESFHVKNQSSLQKIAFKLVKAYPSSGSPADIMKYLRDDGYGLGDISCLGDESKYGSFEFKD